MLLRSKAERGWLLLMASGHHDCSAAAAGPKGRAGEDDRGVRVVLQQVQVRPSVLPGDLAQSLTCLFCAICSQVVSKTSITEAQLGLKGYRFSGQITDDFQLFVL